MNKIRCPVCLGTNKSGKKLKLKDGSYMNLSCEWCNHGFIPIWDYDRICKINKIDNEQMSLNLNNEESS